MTFRRWTLRDPSGTLPDWALPYNPNTIAPQQRALVIEPEALQEDGSNSDRQTPTLPLDWQFGGFLYTLAQLDTLQTWLDLGLPVTLTDHASLSYRVVITAVDTVRGGKRRLPERHTYTVHTLLLGVV